MRRICGLSSQTRNRSLLKSMRNMARPRGHTGERYTAVNHIAGPVNEWLRTDGGGSGGSVAGLLAQDAPFQAMAGVEQHPHRGGLFGKHLHAADVPRVLVIAHNR